MAILVMGATGTIGAQVLAHLDPKAVAVRALTRSPDKANFPAGVMAVQGDPADVDSIRAALDGVSTLFLLGANVADELTQVMLTLNAARDAGVKGVVYLSVFKGADYTDVPHFVSKATVERMIEAHDIPATILRPSYFMQNDLRQKDVLLGAGAFGLPIGDKGISMVDIRDIGEAAARELMRRETAAGPLPRETYNLVGPDAMTGANVAQVWSEMLDRPIVYGGDDIELMEQRLKAFAPAWYAYDLKLMMRTYQEQGAVGTADDVARFEALLGRKLRTYRDFAKAAAAEWQAD